MSQLVSESYEYNMTLMAISLKTYGENRLQYPYKDNNSLNRCQANKNLLSVTTHLHQVKKVSVLVPSDVDSDPVTSRRGLLEAVPIVR
jgi:hypothetical protein